MRISTNFNKKQFVLSKNNFTKTSSESSHISQSCNGLTVEQHISSSSLLLKVLHLEKIIH